MEKKMKYLAFAILFLAGCQILPIASPLIKDVALEHRSIQWIRTDKLPEKCLEKNPKAIGCAVYDPRRCEVYAPEPEHQNDHTKFYILGHEFLHCFNGKFHK